MNIAGNDLALESPSYLRRKAVRRRGIVPMMDSAFRIPFDAADKTVVEVIIHVERPGPGSVTIGQAGVAGG